ncbi:glycoside hydrolase family 88 protein [Algibacter sp. Ld11]|uniref:glycoside hydrolase family 88 protein n=1 Tax=Algibacter sp. Ld11 TaxID=649150 RepID=UPI00386640D2
MLNNKISIIEYKDTILDYALKTSKNEMPKMSLADNTYFPIVLVRELSLMFKKNNRLKNSFPRGYLLNGIFDYAKATNNIKTLNYLEKTIDKFVSELNNNPKTLQYIDQVTMGVVIAKLFQENKNPRYQEACEVIINWLNTNIDKKYGIILYRPNLDFQYVDTLGMICPFLVICAEVFDKNELIKLSNTQLKFYIEHGLNKTNKLPYHAIELQNGSPMGSSNWGRGLGWYLLALSATLKYTNNKNNDFYDFFNKEIEVLKPHLNNFKQKHYWGQFLSSSKKWHIDTSVSTMIFYSLSLIDKSENFNDFYNFLKPLTTKKGEVDHTSGDTEDINIYSREYGKSELTQGLLLSIFKNEITL